MYIKLSILERCPILASNAERLSSDLYKILEACVPKTKNTHIQQKTTDKQVN